MLAMKTGSSLQCSDILNEVDEAISSISFLLENSKQIRSDFASNWVKVLETYETDIAQFDGVLEQLPLTHKRGKKNMRYHGSHHHALNFHMQHGGHSHSNSLDDVFILPPSTDEPDSSFNLDESMSHATLSPKSGSNVGVKGKISDKKQKEEEKKKFDSREKLLTNLDLMREKESAIERQLETGKELTGEPLEDSKKIVLQQALDKCKHQQSVHIIHWITSYKPRKNIKHGKKLNQLIPSMKGTLDDLKKVHMMRDRERTKNGTKRVSKAKDASNNLLAQFPEYKHVGNDKRLCEMIMNDSEQFLSLEDLPFRPMSAAIANPKDLLAESEAARNGNNLNEDDRSVNDSIASSNYEDDYDDDEYYDEKSSESDYADSSFEDE